MGAWYHIYAQFGPRLFERFPLAPISRPESASPATGSAASHRLEQQALVDAALGER